jgi:hypothetical protein
VAFHLTNVVPPARGSDDAACTAGQRYAASLMTCSTARIQCTHSSPSQIYLVVYVTILLSSGELDDTNAIKPARARISATQVRNLTMQSYNRRHLRQCMAQRPPAGDLIIIKLPDQAIASTAGDL